ncbi:MAG: D-glycero-beta-D-manno-heptose-7-phosphate kinase [Nitrospirae bacterium]|nr:D-glycero-beta-D-manno-heptose-7-phosphate kinase [Nitrospirota bacterium]MBI3353037.1 D-glycero-beta-D-manno-heptose-7-phosphate kinase [Nitrospirota bacterium]
MKPGNEQRKRAEHPLRSYVKKFSESRILVIGDLMLDHYIWGTVKRISPEAPVPVVNVTSETMLLGGAANVCHNIFSLGGKTDLGGVIGQDASGEWITRRLREMKVSGQGIIQEPGRPTTRKTRVIAHSQQVVRFDHEKRGDISAESQKKLLSWLEKNLDQYQSIVISDYEKGVVTESLIRGAINFSKELKIKIIVDPKISHFSIYRGVTLLTPNHLEASLGSGIEIEDEASLMKAGQTILKKLDCESVLITRGEHGMSLFENSGEVTHIPTVAKKVFDVTGAGDTVVSVLSLALSAGANLKDSAVLANHAAGIVVGIVGTATVTQQTLLDDLNHSL